MATVGSIIKWNIIMNLSVVIVMDSLFAIVYECVCLELKRYLVYKLTQFPAAVLDTCYM